MTNDEDLKECCADLAEKLQGNFSLDDAEEDLEELARRYGINESDKGAMLDALATEWVMSNWMDIEYRINDDGHFKSVKVAATVGGPQIYIDTGDNYVKGFWGSSAVRVPFHDEIGFEDFFRTQCEELIA